MAQLLYANQYFLTSLNVGGGITNSQTTGIICADVTGVDTTKPGVACLTYTDPLNTDNAEWIEYTSINGSKEFVGVTRGFDGYSAKTHSNGAVISFPLSESHINRLADALSIGADPTNGVAGTLDEDDMASNSATKLATQQSIKAYVTSMTAGDGWVSAGESWAYASATTITVPSGAASKYAIGDKIKLTQTTVKYFYVVAVADTVLTVSGGSTYTVANAAITLNYYSHVENPIGFPHWFQSDPTLTGGTPPTFTTAKVGRFSMTGRTVRYTWYGENSAGGTAGSGANTLLFSLPVAPANSDGRIFGLGQWYNGGTTGHLSIRNDGTNGYFQKLTTTYLQSVDLNNATRFIYAEMTYEA